MKTNFYKYIFGGLVGLVALTGCNTLVEEPAYTDTPVTQAALTIEMALPVEVAQTKSIANDPRNSSNTWGEWDKYTDGTLLYNLTLFVVNADGKLVGYRQIHQGSQDVDQLNGFYDGDVVNTGASNGTAVKITFPQSDPLHGNVELLGAGNYTLIAVANHAAVTSGEKSYAGLGKAAEDGIQNYNGGGDFNQIVSGIISSFTAANGLPGFNAGNYPSFFNYRLNAGADRVCRLNPQPLVMIRKVTLGEGNNTVQGELSRTFARIRLEVNNRSENTILDISDLEFISSFASQSAYLLNDVEAGNANFFSNFSLYDGNSSAQDNTKGLLDVNSTDAIVAASSTKLRVLAGGTDPIFDAYILEGKVNTSAESAFSFNATYAAKMEDGDATHNAIIANFFSDNKYNGSSSSMNWTYYGIIDPAFYIFIRSNRSNVSTCLMADEKNLKAVVEDAQAGNEQNRTFKMAPEFIWEMEIPGGKSSVQKVGNYGSYVEYAPGHLKSLSSNLYLQPYNGSQDKAPVLASTPGNVIFKMNFAGEDEFGTVFCQYNGSYYYLNATTCQWAGPVTNMNNYEMLTFETIIAEPVQPKQKAISSHIQMKDNGGTTVNKYEITRNEFFHGVIPVNIGN